MDDDRDGALDASSSHFRAAASAGSSREETGNRIMRRGEAALARTRLEVSEWNLALFDAKQHLVAANKEFSSGPAQLFKDKKPELADLARRIKVVEKQVCNTSFLSLSLALSRANLHSIQLQRNERSRDLTRKTERVGGWERERRDTTT